ncbi:carboxypeptidase M32 [Deinococcus deserti]|uniref:Metal-dependent carboxypeptidase n=1 Tax=Deinococcus deserti (strain DSM 17065 / CIP 109153 / LMG 22923 / VCD115) TaxID=546414 RepID=C1D3B8_DEIDV|nr:carboxypeptidase M32 [Deinococcus deserti]ACO47997.1 putative carboxypeptidase Taq (Thermostable carboxypeptidase 1) [Deinococcus deserti VCD115]
MNEFQQQSAEINDLLCILNLLTWDTRTQMPPGGSQSRAQQTATLSGLAQQRLLDPAFEHAARAALSAAEPASVPARAAQQAISAVRALKRVPVELTRDLALTKSAAQDAWADARAHSDFSRFAPHLTRMVDLQRRLADALGYDAHPYDALLNLYEPGLTAATLQPLFSQLRTHHLSLLREVQAQPQPRLDFLERDYDVAAQQILALELAQAIGYDLTRGRLDASAHPFEISFTREDVRITTRYHPNFLPGALFGVLHEAGHAMYEQGVSSELSRSVLASDLLGLYAVGGASYGTHESQSRLWENRVGRSRAFWDQHYPRAQALFSSQLADVTVVEFHRAVNRVQPSLIRVEADELTYDLHIMLRVDIESALIAGDLKVQDLPEMWNARIESDLGLKVPDDARGVLQDIHWSAGLFGSFPTYTVGNIMAAQFYEAAHAALPDLEASLARGEYGPLRIWLTEQVYQHGRTFTPHELLERTTGRGLDAAPYLTYLSGKYRDLYGVTEKETA